MTKYLCAIPLPVEAALAIREIQESYKSASWNILIEPHITLVPPGVAVSSSAEAEEMLRAAVAGVTPFDITICGVDIFKNQSNTIFAKVEPSEELMKLQYEVYRASIGFIAKPNVRSEQSGNHFHPHITLSNKLNSVLAEQILAQLSEQRIDFSFCCDSISLFVKEPGDVIWSESKRLSF